MQAGLQQEEFETIAEQAKEPSYAAFLNSKAWKKLKALVLKRAGGRCEACLSKPAVCVHHVGYELGRMPPAWMLRALCPACHQRFHNKTILPNDWKPKNSQQYET